jgi:hypothetical protein
MRAKRRSAREVWAERVTRLKESGLTARQFAAKTGLNAQSLRWWRWQLSSKSTSPPSTTRALVRRPATTVAKSPPRISPLTFVEMTAAVDVDRLEVVLPSGVRIRVRPGFDADTLGRLLDVLEARR